MNTAPSDVFALAEKRLAWIGQRQGVLAQNIANANTPGYVAKDIKSFGEVLASQTGPGMPAPAVVPVANASGRSLDGNGVVLDEQLEKVAETDGAQQLASNLYKKYVGLFKTVIGRN